MAMTLKFAHFVDLLECLERCKYDRAITTNRNTNPEYTVIREWFRINDERISRHGPAAVALLSCLFPERLTQRTYNIREQSLTHIIPRVLAWGSSRAMTLRGWRDTQTEFAVLVEAEMARTENASPKPPKALTVEEVDAALFQLAANSHSSAPAIRGAKNGREVEDVLTPIFSRLKAREAKWFVRLILKDLRVIQVPEKIALECLHFLLPDLLGVVSDFGTGIDFLSQESIKKWPINPSPVEAKRLKHEAAKIFQPKPGTMIPRTAYDKARSLKHAVNLARSRTLSVERKYDGEYCQIHIQRGHDQDTIQIFSKSGKDSTMDRGSLHGAITASLDLAGQNCKIKSRCVLEGELVVWSRCQQTIQPFYKIRNHVRHGGRRLGRANDRPRDPQEQLMIIFYDLLLLDDEVKLITPHNARRQHLKGLVKTIPGVSMLVERQLVDCNHQGRPRACTERLRQIFAHAITNKWEGLVLKGRDDPYLSFVNNPRGIKLKKDYLAQLGDVIDVCIVGGRLDPRISNQGQLKWNTFYLACLVNKEACLRFGELPSFSIIDSFCDGTGAIPKQDLEHLNATGIFCEADYETEINEYKTTMLMQGDPPTVLFRKPFVVECFGAGFDKNSDCAFWTLRFPRLARVHHDRSFMDTIDFAVLQTVAEQAQIDPVETDNEEVQRWVQRLVQAEGKSGFEREALASPSTGSVPRTPHSATTASLSPVAARNRPPSLPRVWKQVQTRSASVSKTHVREDTQQTTTTSTRTPSTARTWLSPDSVPFLDLPAVPESAPAAVQQGLNSHSSMSLVSIGPTSKKRRRSNDMATPHLIKRPRLVGGRTVLETPTPPRDELDLTQSSPNVTPIRITRPVEEPTALTSFGRLGTRSVDSNMRPCPLSLSLSRPLAKTSPTSRKRRTSSIPSVDLDRGTAGPRKRSRISVSVERRPLAEMSSESPSQRARPVLSQTSPASLDPVKESILDKVPTPNRRQQQGPQQRPQASIPFNSASTLRTPPSTEEGDRRAEVSSKTTSTCPDVTIVATSPCISFTRHVHPTRDPEPAARSHTSTLRKTRSAARSTGPMSHKARLAAAQASTTVIDDSPDRPISPVDTYPSNVGIHPNRPQPTTAPSSPVLRPHTTSSTSNAKLKRAPNPIILLTPSALAALDKESPAATESGKDIRRVPQSSAVTTLLAKRSVMDNQAGFTAKVVEGLASQQQQQVRRTATAAGQRFVVLVDSCAAPKIVADEVRVLVRGVVRELARRNDGGGSDDEADEDKVPPRGQGVQADRHAIAVLDYRVVEWLAERRQTAVRPRGRLEGAREVQRVRVERGHEHESGHFVCAIRVSDGGADGVVDVNTESVTRWRARVVWRDGS